MKANPPIAGHELLYEGRIRNRWHWWHPGAETDWVDLWRGGCRCGAKPEEFPCGSTTMKRWHRAHKAGLRGDDS